MHQRPLNHPLQMPRAMFKSVPSVSKNARAGSVRFITKGTDPGSPDNSLLQLTPVPAPESSATVRNPARQNTTTLSMRFMNSGVNFRRAASTPTRDNLSVSDPHPLRRHFASVRSASDIANPKFGLKMRIHFGRASIARHEDPAPARNPPCGYRRASAYPYRGCRAAGPTTRRWLFNLIEQNG